ncbi:MAG: phenylalanine--tRNA ligase subunit beta, partial [Lentihominibacter sp.]|nr:phenylalanine--tRNA ligase subunit beta [Lentihominibacter sp.]
SPLPKYPSTSRDIALLVDEDMEVGAIERIIKAHGETILESVKLFDVYRGKQVEEGKKSVAFNLTYRDKDKTLTDEEVTAVHNGVLEALKNELNAVLREM